MHLSQFPFFSLRSTWSALLIGALLATLIHVPVQAQPQLVEEAFSTSPAEPEAMIEFSDGNTTRLCFFAFDGDGLFCTDGSTLEQVSSIVPDDPGKTRSQHVAVYNQTLYFVGDDGDTGDELWQYDGSTVSLAAELTAGSDGSNPGNLFVYDGALYFGANGDAGSGLWKYDGTDASFVQSFDDRFDEDFPSNFAVYDDGTSSGADLYFNADGGSDGSELWRYDGSSTNQVDNITGDSFSSEPEALTVYDDGGASGADLYFRAENGSSGRELFRYEDGASAGIVEDINSGSDDGLGFSNFAVYSGALYFEATAGTDGNELWKYDGSSSSPSQVVDINSSDGSFPSNFFLYDDGGSSGTDLYFQASAGDGSELHNYDGSTVSQVKDIHPGKNNFGDPAGSGPRDFAVFDGSLYFAATDNAGTKLYAYDGSVAAQAFERNITGGPEEKIVYDGDLYFSAGNESKGTELWRYTGTTISRVTDINSGPDNSDPSEFIVYNDGSGAKLYFQADDGSEGTELYSYDGSTVNQIVINDGDRFSDSDPQDFAVYNGVLYFSASDGEKGPELWKYDGSSPEIAVDINTDNSGSRPGSNPSGLTVYDDGSGAKLYFAADDRDGSQQENTELYVFDGGTVSEAADINSNTGSFPSNLTVYDDGGSSGADLYFQADDGNTGDELWRYDGSETTLVGDLNTSGNGAPSNLTVYDDGGSSGADLYFSAQDGSSGQELWRFENEGSAPSQIQDINSGPGDSSPDDLAVFGDRLYFTANNGSEGREPHAFDGSTVDGIDLFSGSSSSGGGFPATFDDGSGTDLYITATNGRSGRELFRVEKSDPLPVELASFDVRLEGDEVRLAWQTASEQNNAGFRVQRTVPSTESDWTTLGQIEGAGTTTQSQSYRFTDANLPYDARRITYRLKQVDTDGETHFSEEITVTPRAPERFRVKTTYPNPADGRVTVQYEVPESQSGADVQLRLYDALGRLVKTMQVTSVPGRHEHQFATSSLASGVYVLQMSTGDVQRSRRLTITR